MTPLRRILTEVLAPLVTQSIDDESVSIRGRAIATWILTRSDSRDATARLQSLAVSKTAPSTIRTIAIYGLSRHAHFDRAGSEQTLRHAAAHDPRQHCRIAALFRLAAHDINPRDVENLQTQDWLQAITQLTA